MGIDPNWKGVMIAKDYQFPYTVRSVSHSWWFSNHVVMTIKHKGQKLVVLSPRHVTLGPHSYLEFRYTSEIRDVIVQHNIHSNPVVFKNFVIGWLPEDFCGRLVLAGKDTKLSNPMPTKTQYAVWQWFAPEPEEYQSYLMMQKLKGEPLDFTIDLSEDIYGS